jgi:hypothetical protein
MGDGGGGIGGGGVGGVGVGVVVVVELVLVVVVLLVVVVVVGWVWRKGTPCGASRQTSDVSANGGSTDGELEREATSDCNATTTPNK